MKNIFTYRILTIAIFVALLVPSLVQQGMFLDGITYAAISKNMAAGYGELFNPHYTKTLYPVFSEHPPLVFIIESLFFKVFGDHFITERIFSFATAIFTALGIIACWKELAKDSVLKANNWFPVFLWLLIPVVSWSYTNNLLENTMTVFTTFSVFFIVKALIRNNIKFLLLGGLLTICAFLSKGFVGLFPLATPLIYGLVFGQFKKAVTHFLILSLSVSIVAWLILQLFPEISENLTRYIDQQFVPALIGEREITTSNRFNILIDLSLELSVVMVLFAIFFFKKMIRRAEWKSLNNKNFLFFLLVGISASVPLIISLKQRKFYLLPSIPFYALSFGYFFYDLIMEQLDKISEHLHQWLRRSIYLILCLTVVLSIIQYGNYSRDEKVISDVSLISNKLKEGTIISCSKEIWSDWSLTAYFSRIGYISLDCNNDHPYRLIKNEDELLTKDDSVVVKGLNYSLLKRNGESISSEKE